MVGPIEILKPWKIKVPVFLVSSDTCKDRIEGCKELANSNVCETSKDAMIVNCPHTCNFCGKEKWTSYSSICRSASKAWKDRNILNEIYFRDFSKLVLYSAFINKRNERRFWHYSLKSFVNRLYVWVMKYDFWSRSKKCY